MDSLWKPLNIFEQLADVRLVPAMVVAVRVAVIARFLDQIELQTVDKRFSAMATAILVAVIARLLDQIELQNVDKLFPAMATAIPVAVIARLLAQM